ncbi:unnamed protein product [Protopolystoma xenopodis]|uniref:Uncharacterized protein n=1 Tax=Protopolystoma xenopodis TaxID=117903 RepID=A0A448WHN3_9PLAT|nr:unnamed protein product [Protopolystoma xenopodis]
MPNTMLTKRRGMYQVHGSTLEIILHTMDSRQEASPQYGFPPKALSNQAGHNSDNNGITFLANHTSIQATPPSAILARDHSSNIEVTCLDGNSLQQSATDSSEYSEPISNQVKLERG